MPLQTCRRLIPLFAVLLLAGCASNNNIAPQSSLIDTQQLHLHQAKAGSQVISPQWWRDLHDPQSVMERADAANAPYLDVNGAMRRERVAKNTIPPFLNHYPDAPIYSGGNSLGLNLSYEFDWWGKYRDQVNAAKARVDATRADIRALGGGYQAPAAIPKS